MRLSVKQIQCILFVAAVCFLPLIGSAQEKGSVEVYALSGKASYRSAPSAKWKDLTRGEKLPLSGSVKVGKNSRLGLRFPDGRLVRLRENSELKLTPADGKNEEGLNLVNGALHLFNRLGKAKYTVNTPEVSAAIRGTELVASSVNGESIITIYDGEVLLEAQSQTLRLQKGETGAIKRGEAPRKLLITKPVDQVQWALYFPAIFTDRDFKQFQTDGDTILQSVYNLAFEAKYGLALDMLNTHAGGSKVELIRASLLMVLGSPAQAEALLLSASQSTSRNGVHARLGVLALIKQDLASANQHYQASRSSGSSATAYLLGSLLKSNEGDLEAAYHILDEALRDYPDEPTFLARKAELQLGLGKTKKALATAHQAYLARPTDPFITTILGFTYLARQDSEAASKSFEAALDAYADLPDAHFGHALSLMGQGKLAEGRAELETTVHLDSARSLYRSYLGKAFFEEEREEAAEKEYALAIERDADDPTPYLYRAFNRLSRNNIVGALEDVEDSISRNDARAVFRSRSLLDQDLSVRTTSLSEVFRQLGFRDLAKIEAMKSISHDYTNYSAHRLLGEVLEGDYYADAQFSQRLISELLSPLSFNTFQSFNGFSSEPSSGDYAALFDKPEHRTELNFTGTNVDDEYQGSVLQAGREGQIGYLATYGHRTLGPSNLTENNARLALQYQPSPDHRFIVEGELSTFDDKITEDEFELYDVTGAIGSYHRLSEATQIISRFEYFRREVDTDSPLIFDSATQNLILATDALLFPEFEIDLRQSTNEDINTVRGNVQVIHQESFGTLVSGVEHIYAEGSADENSAIIGDELGVFDGISQNRNSWGDYNTNTISVYSYLTSPLTEWVDMTAGLSFRRVELPAFGTIAPYVSGERVKERFSPKLGFTVTPTDDITIRAAYFRNLGASSVNDIGSIEPTVVGSFVQLLGDLPGVNSETLGIGIDYKIPKQLYAGIEYSYRDLNRDDIAVITDFTTDATTLTDTFALRSENTAEHEIENLIRAYVYGIVSEEVSTLLEYRRDGLEALDIDEVNETDRVRLGGRYFSPQRWFALTDLDWYNQRLKSVLGFEDGDENFWILNAGLGYRIPKRHGQVRFQVINILDDEFQFASRRRFTDPPSGIGFLADFSINF